MHVRVFGSAVRNALTPESDIDSLVTAGDETSAWFPVGFMYELEDLLQRPIDVMTEKALHKYIRAQVLSEAVAL